MIKKIKLGLFFLFLLSVQVFAQTTLQRVAVPHPQSNLSSSKARTLATGDTLKLPFFDDFTLTYGNPNPTYWLRNGGVFVNDQFAVNPPTFNTATFDGLNGNGVPYNAFVNPLQIGSADTLLSKPINLLGESAVYLLFYWQPEGLGEKPDAEDSLVLQFKNKDQSWSTVWFKNGLPLQPFQKVQIDLGAAYYYNAFQFRFRSYCKLSGRFDTWHIDYVYLNNRRYPTNGLPFQFDLAFSNLPSSILKNYSSVPYKHFINDPASFLAKEINASISNFDIIEKGLNLKIQVQGKDVSFTAPPGLIKPQTLNIPIKIIPSIGNLNLNPTDTVLNLKTFYQLRTGDERDNNVGFERNDTVTRITKLSNYYAYDDGSAEYALSINQKFSRVAYRYVASQISVLTDIDIHFENMVDNPVGLSFNLWVWKKDKKDSLFVKNYVVPSSSKSFIRFDLGKYLTVEDTFWIGWQQTADKNLNIGFDSNINSSQNIFFNIGTGWIPYTEAKGSLMMRPVFRTIDPNSIQDEKNLDLKVKVYPNPAKDILYFSSAVNSCEVFDLAGKLLIQNGKKELIDQVTIDELARGIYIIRLKKGNQILNSRFVKE